MKREITILRVYGFVMFMGVGAFFPYIFLYMRGLGFSNAQIGVLGALGPMVMMLVQPIWGWICDSTERPERVSFWLALGVAGSLGLLLIGRSFISIFIYLSLFNVFYSSLIPTYDSIVIRTLENQSPLQVSYGQVRWLGSLGYALTAFSVGRIIEGTKMSVILWIYLAVAVLSALLATRLPKVSVYTGIIRDKVKIWPLFKNREFLIFLIAGALVIGSNAINYTFFPFLFTELGGGEGLLGLAMLISAFAEIPFFFFSAKFHKRFKLSYLLIAAFVVTGLRWYLYSAAKSPLQLLVLQLLHGITYGLLYSTSVIYVSKLAPERLRVSAQNLFWAATFGFGNVIANLVGGWVYEYYPVQILFKLASIAAVVGTIVFFVGIVLPDRRV